MSTNKERCKYPGYFDLAVCEFIYFFAVGLGYGDGEKETLGLSALDFDKGCGPTLEVICSFPHRAVTASFELCLFDLARICNLIEPC
jgi:hypothetical protein